MRSAKVGFSEALAAKEHKSHYTGLWRQSFLRFETHSQGYTSLRPIKGEWRVYK